MKQDIALPLRQLTIHIEDGRLTSRSKQELIHLAERFLELAESIPEAPEVPATAHALISGHLRARRAREKIFPPSLFGEPAWDLLLDLYLAQRAQRSISISSACSAAAVPATTALRWINMLEQYGLLVRSRDLTDGRRHFLNLSSHAAQAMNDWARHVAP